MTTALIFLVWSGKRMNSRSRPKQFLEMHGKPIIIYTLEHFEYHDAVDNMVVVCLEDWIKELQGMLDRYGIQKTARIIPGGETGHDSIYRGLRAMAEFAEETDIVLIHDGVRPLINADLITENIEAVKKYGSAVTVEASRESVVRSIDRETICEVPPRAQMYTAKAPQGFRYGDITALYARAERDNVKTIDPSHLCSLYGAPMHIVMSTKNNLKITEPADYYVYRALYEALEGQQIYGV